MGGAQRADRSDARQGGEATPPSRLSNARIAEIARGLAHPARVSILAQLGEAETHLVKDLVGDLPLAQSTVSQHLRILCEADLLVGRKVGAGTQYCVRPATLQQFAAAVAALAPARPDDAAAGPTSP